jgi:hypothetical protein
VDGAGVQVHVDGADVQIVAEDVGAFVARVREAATARTGVAPGRRDLGGLAGLAEALAASGITANLESPTRPVAVAGAGVASPAGALLLGTRRVRPARPWWSSPPAAAAGCSPPAPSRWCWRPSSPADAADPASAVTAVTTTARLRVGGRTAAAGSGASGPTTPRA